MHSRTLAGAGLTAAALAIATAFAGTASGHVTTDSAVTHHAVTASKAAPAKGKACYTNNDPSGDSGVGIASENDSSDSGIDSQGAVDFTVKKSCTVGTVAVSGAYYNNGGGPAGPAESFNFLVYKNSKGEPSSKPFKEFDNLKFKDTSGGTGDVSLTLKKALKLKKGNYFATVVANMTLATNGQWGWELTSNQVGGADQWENQGGEFGVCPTWGDVLTCTTYGNDFMLTLSS